MKGLVMAEVSPDAIAIVRNAIDPIPIKSKTDIRRSTGIDFQFFTKPPNELQDLDSCGPHGTDRHHQRIDNHISLNTMILGTFDNLFCHFETDIRIFGDPGFIIEMATTAQLYFLSVDSRRSSSRLPS